MPDLSSIYCRKCDYNLTGLSEPRCPECGQGFDPSNPRTFYARSWDFRFRRQARRALILTAGLLLTFGLAAGGGLGWLYWGWRTEQSALKALMQVRGYICIRPVDLGRVSHLLPARWQWMLDRASSIFLSDPTRVWAFSGLPPSLCFTGNADLTDRDLVHLESLHYLTHVALLCGPHVTDDGFRPLQKLRRLQGLTLDCGGPGWGMPPRITGAGFVYLKDLPNLRQLSVGGAPITDESLANLAGMQWLDSIDLSYTPVGDAGLIHLRSLSHVHDLRLDHTNVGDASIPTLLAMRLQQVSLAATKVSPQGLHRLKASIPMVSAP